MSWQNRILEASYTSPSGVRAVFDYEDVRKSFDKKTASFNFPDANGTLIQDTGNTSRQIPLRLFFSGADHDLQSDAFDLLLREKGVGRLDHPAYGKINVVPFGKVSQRDDLKSAANQSIIEVTFWETIGINYPTSQRDPSSNVLFAVDKYNNAASLDFSNVTNLSTEVERSSFKNSYNILLSNTKNTLDIIAKSQEDVQTQFDSINSSINRGIDVLIGQPLTLAFQTMLMIQSPARALTNIKARLNAYGDLAQSIVSSSGVSTRGNHSENINKFHANDLYASTYITGQIVSVVNNQFTTQPEALLAAEKILDLFSEVSAWRDDNYESLDLIDTGGAYQQLQESVALTAGFLVQISFTLKQERTKILDRSRTIIDLTAELYGVVDEKIDFLINTNNLSGSEILELPKGREIVYYV